MNITINLTITIGTAADGTQTVTIAPSAASAPEPVPTPPPVVAAPVAASEALQALPTYREAVTMVVTPPADEAAAAYDQMLQHEPSEPYTDDDDDADGEPVMVDLFAMTPAAPVETSDDDVSEDALMRAMQAIQANRRLPRGTAKCVAILEERGWVTERDGRRVATSTGSIEVNRWSRKNRT